MSSQRGCLRVMLCRASAGFARHGTRTYPYIWYCKWHRDFRRADIHAYYSPHVAEGFRARGHPCICHHMMAAWFLVRGHLQRCKCFAAEILSTRGQTYSFATSNGIHPTKMGTTPLHCRLNGAPQEHVRHLKPFSHAKFPLYNHARHSLCSIQSLGRGFQISMPF